MNGHCTVHEFVSAGVRQWRKIVSWGLLMVWAGSGSAHTQQFPRSSASEEIVARMEQANTQRQQELQSYQARRHYSVSHPFLGNSAYLVVEEHYLAPEQKQFRVLERSGPPAVEKRFFARLLQAERDAARGPSRQAVELCRRNYNFTFREYDPAAEAYIFQVEPRSSSPYLLRGTIWVNAQDYAVQRIEGRPASLQSLFVRQTSFVHKFAKFGDFWFPVHHRSEAVFLFGRATLEINYFDYQWQSR